MGDVSTHGQDVFCVSSPEGGLSGPWGRGYLGQAGGHCSLCPREADPKVEEGGAV